MSAFDPPVAGSGWKDGLGPASSHRCDPRLGLHGQLRLLGDGLGHRLGHGLGLGLGPRTPEIRTDHLLLFRRIEARRDDRHADLALEGRIVNGAEDDLGVLSGLVLDNRRNLGDLVNGEIHAPGDERQGKVARALRMQRA